jgi:hypothetical protein
VPPTENQRASSLTVAALCGSTLQRAVRKALALLVALWLVSGAVASADDISDFDAARAFYEKHNYRAAAASFGALVGTEPPRLQSAVLIAESRKYLAASRLFLGDEVGARAAFLQLLRREPEYALDPVAFPRDVVMLFEDIKHTLVQERARAQEAEALVKAEAERIAQEIAARDRDNLRRLEAMAAESHQELRNSRFIASIPFGVGQFQNGHRGFGMALLVTEGILAATSVVTYIAHQRVADDHPSDQSTVVETRQAERIAFIANVSSFSLFAGLALVGMVDAHVRFVEGRETSRPRLLPPDLQRWLNERGLALSAQGLHF